MGAREGASGSGRACGERDESLPQARGVVLLPRRAAALVVGREPRGSCLGKGLLWQAARRGPQQGSVKEACSGHFRLRDVTVTMPSSICITSSVLLEDLNIDFISLTSHVGS